MKTLLQNKKKTAISISTIRECDFESLMSVFKHEEVGKTYMVPDLSTKEQERLLFSRLLELSKSGEKFVMGIFLENRLIGIINQTDLDDKIMELGYAIHPDFSGKGLMTAALKEAISFLFKNGIEEITAGAFESNIASIRVMQKCGMKLTDKTEDIEYRGQFHRCIFYSVKKSH